jgi:hypothetical protein
MAGAGREFDAVLIGREGAAGGIINQALSDVVAQRSIVEAEWATSQSGKELLARRQRKRT